MDAELRRTDNLSVFLKTSVIHQLCSFLWEKSREIKKQQDLEYVTLFFTNRLIQRIPLNHHMHFNLNDINVLEH